MRERRNLPLSGKRKRDKLLMLLAALYFLGVVLGTVMYCTSGSGGTAVIDRLTDGFIAGRLSHSFGKTLINSFSGGFLLLTLCFLMGFCTIAVPAEMLVPLFRGLGTGAVIAGMYGKYGIPGTAAAAVLVIPNAVMTAFILIMASRESVRFSAALYRNAFGNDGERPDVKLYFTKFVILSVGLAVSSLADSLITFASAGWWTSLTLK